MSNANFDIPVAAADTSGNEVKYVTDAIRSTWLAAGTYKDQFEDIFADCCGTRAAISVCNGTVALHLALLALDVGPGDEVLVPSLTYVATANCVRYVGAEPVFVDVDPDTWCIDPGKLEAALTPRTKGILVVHLYGHPADMDAISQVARAHKLWLVEDAAEAHLAKYKGRVVGGLADLATFSFYGNKIFTSGEGGAITLNESGLEGRLKSLRGQGMDPQRQYFFPIIGYNYRLSNVACAILCAQLERRAEIWQRRQRIFASYRRLLEGVPGLGFQPIASWAEPAPWLFCLTVDEKAYGHSRDALMSFLAEQGIETRPFFLPLHKLPPYREQSSRRGDDLPITDHLSDSGMNLPTFNAIPESSIDRITDLVKRFRG